MNKIYAHDLKITGIAKRDQIRAWSKDGQNYIEGSGHWLTDDGKVYMWVDQEESTIKDCRDILLDPKEWDIYIGVKFCGL